MKLLIDIGNTSTHIGLRKRSGVLENFRIPSHFETFRHDLRERFESLGRPGKAAVCSVRPELLPAVSEVCEKLWDLKPLVVDASREWGIRSSYENPRTYGADRLAAVLGARSLFPGTPLIVADVGTATTFCAIDRNGRHLGGMIAPGPGLAARALFEHTARLPQIQPVDHAPLLGTSTKQALESGIYHQQYFFIREAVDRIRREIFAGARAVCVGTGGDAAPFAEIFDHHVENLVLLGLEQALHFKPSPLSTRKESPCDARL